ncbi:MAG: SAM-dependent methyltransferase [Flavobacteriales bacterium]|nr:SAM-dependent methyltransferase [Flavobacteriales bacterium]
MSTNARTYSEGWEDYELLDAGGGKKLERWGKIITIRPELQAYFHSGKPFTEWREMAHWEFIEDAKGQTGKWKSLKKDAPRKWVISYKRLKFVLELTKFKHIGLFPEQQSNWEFIEENLKSETRFLNLFAYTGAASCVARNIGADTFHVDSAKSVMTWANQNMEESRLLNIRWVHEDALKFIQREEKRGNKFQGILMDPPAWGIGAKGEKWKLEDRIDELMGAAANVLDKDGFLIMNTYSPMVDVNFISELSDIYFETREKQITELYMETKTDKFLYYGNLLRVK